MNVVPVLQSPHFTATIQLIFQTALVKNGTFSTVSNKTNIFYLNYLNTDNTKFELKLFFCKI